ncbi:MAG: PAS domain S-box protein, partial [Desulfobacterales bacterium]|nr:PAS domain S-box protein [Desulfobacterales bacterium]
MTGKPTYEALEQMVRKLEKDAVKRKRAEKAVYESEEKFKAIAGSAKDAIIIMDNEGNISYWNKAAENIFGYLSDEALGKEMHIFLAPEKYHKSYEIGIHAFRETGNGRVLGKTLELEAVKKDGTIFPMELSVSAVKIDDKWNAVGIVRDISERKEIDEELRKHRDQLEEMVKERTLELTKANEELQAEIAERKRVETQLRESEEKFRAIFDSATDGIVIVDSETEKFFIGNFMFCEMLGYSSEEINNFKIEDIHPREDLPYVLAKFHDQVRGKYSLVPDIPVKRKDGSIFYADINSSVISIYGKPYLMGIFRDITKRKQAEEERNRLEAQLYQAQKMEAIGTLSGGIAHDFNNILGAIIGYAELAQLSITQEAPVKAKLDEILKAADRAKNLVKQILRFSRQGEMGLKVLQLSLIVKETLKWLRATLPTTIEIRQNIKKDSGVVLADPTQIHQLFMNLCTNAAHAMRDKGGVLEVSVVNVNIDDAGISKYPDMRKGQYVRLTVSDTGHGMDTEVMDRIFDPYFTTKEKGMGTGLGLAIVQGIVQTYGGKIFVYSRPGKGTTFHVFLPRIYSKSSVKTAPEEALPMGSERILFVDDEPALRNIGQQMIDHLGYKTVTKASGIEALETFRAQSDQFDLVI